MGNCPFVPRIGLAACHHSQSFFPDAVTRELEDAAFCKTMQFVQQECLDNYDDESEKADKPTATAPKKERVKKQPVLEHTDKHGAKKELPPETKNWHLLCVDSYLCRTDSQKAKKTRNVFLPSPLVRAIKALPRTAK
jgi:hypothetical protein